LYPSKIRITNDGNGPQVYSLRITDEAGWTSSADKNTAAMDTFVLSAIFAPGSETNIESGYFNEIASDDVVTTVDTASSSTRFASSRLSENGAIVPAGGVRSLWLKLKSPLKDSSKGVVHPIKVTITAQAQ